jgi:hypothetical protein
LRCGLPKAIRNAWTCSNRWSSASDYRNYWQQEPKITDVYRWFNLLIQFTLQGQEFLSKIRIKLISTSVLVYNPIMSVSPAALNALLEDAITRDRTTARRAALLRILHQERFLTREQLIVRVEGVLGVGSGL